MTTSVPLVDMRDIRARLHAPTTWQPNCWLCSLDEPILLKVDGTPDRYGATVGRQQIVYQHANHLGLPVDEVSPCERRSQYEAAMKAAKNELRRR